jgi:uncharacterized membrane protein
MGFFTFIALVVAIVASVRAGKASRVGEELVREVRGLRNQLLLERTQRNDDRKRVEARVAALDADLTALRGARRLPLPPALEAEEAPEVPEEPQATERADEPALPTEDSTATVRQVPPTERRGLDAPPVQEEDETDDAEFEPGDEPDQTAGDEEEAPVGVPTFIEAPVLDFRAPAPPKINLEEWLGVKGAAVAGAILVAFAGLLLFKVSIERGWFPPSLRVMSGVLAGLACVGGAQTSRLRRYAITADAVGGAGIVILFASFWAARVLYEMIPVQAAFLLMGATTAACIALSLRHDSKLIATLGLAGGFATPLLLTTGSDNVIGLFGWILLLDLGFLYVARNRGWTWLAGLSMFATLAYQALWIFSRMGPDRLVIGVGILILFGVVFAAASRGLPDDQRARWGKTQAAALLFPLVFGMYFAGHSDIGATFGPTAAMLMFVAIGAAWIGHEDPNRGPLQGAVAIGSLPVVALFLMRHGSMFSMTDAGAENAVLKASVLLVALAAAHHLSVELDRNPDRVGGARTAGFVSALGGGAVALGAHLASGGGLSPWVALLGIFGCSAFLLRQSMLPGRAAGTPLAAVLIGLALSVPLLRFDLGNGFPPPLVWLALMVVVAAGFQVWSKAPGVSDHRVGGHTAAALPILFILSFSFSPHLSDFVPVLVLGGGLVLGAMAAFAATRLDEGWWFALAMGATAKLQTVWGFSASSIDVSATASLGLLFGLIGVAFFSTWPLWVGPRFRSSRPAWYGAAMAGPLWFLSLREHFETLAGDGFGGVPPLVLGAVAVGVLLQARRQWPEEDLVRRSAVVWLAAVALCFLSAAVPMQLENSWVTIAWAVEAWALLVLWKRLDHPGLKYFAVALYAAVFVRLCFNPWVLEYAPRGGMRIFNWLTYTYLVPVAAMILGARVLAPIEAERARSWEALSIGAARVAGLIIMGAVAIGFAWTNLTVLDWFAEGDRLRVDLSRLPARDLALSLSWVAYAGGMLVLGVARRAAALRWVGLLLLVVTIVKVFLYDLGHLDDLYRVASFIGLGVSLILVSVLYQRFVSGRGEEDAQ